MKDLGTRLSIDLCYFETSPLYVFILSLLPVWIMLVHAVIYNIIMALPLWLPTCQAVMVG